MNKFLLLTSASVLAIGVASQAQAGPAVQTTFAEICTDAPGTTVSVDTAVKGAVEEIETSSTCGIILENDAKLSIKDSEIVVIEDETVFASVLISGDGSVDIRNSFFAAEIFEIDLTSGDITIRDSEIDADDSTSATTKPPALSLATDNGAIDLKYNTFTADDGVEIDGTSGDVEVVWNTFTVVKMDGDDPNFPDVEIGASGGNIDVANNDFDVGGDLRADSTNGDVEVKGNTGGVRNLDILGVEVTVKANDIVVSESLRIDADNALQVKDNDFSPINGGTSVDSSNGPCDIKDNTPELASIADCGP